VLRADYLLSTSTIFKRHEFNNEETTAYFGWVKALFDSNSEGIEDSILRCVRIPCQRQAASALKLMCTIRQHHEAQDVTEAGRYLDQYGLSIPL